MHALVIRAGEAEPVAEGAQLDARWKARSGEPSERETQTDLGTESTRPSTAQQEAITRLQNDIYDFVRGPPVPARDWKPILLRSRHDHNMEEIQPPENVTWEHLRPSLPPNGRAAHVRPGGTVERTTDVPSLRAVA